MKNNYPFIERLLEYSKEFEKLTKDSPLEDRTFAVFIHWVFEKIDKELENYK